MCIRDRWKVSFRRLSLRPVGWPQANLLRKCWRLRSSNQISSTGKQRLELRKLDLCGATFREGAFPGPQLRLRDITGPSHARESAPIRQFGQQTAGSHRSTVCLLYTSDAADEEDSVDLGGRRIIKK